MTSTIYKKTLPVSRLFHVPFSPPLPLQSSTIRSDKMHLPSTVSLVLAALAPAVSAGGKDPSKNYKGLDHYAKKAGLQYFGSATDSPGQRERAGYEAVYPKYDEIMWKSGEFGQTTPTNGQKVSRKTKTFHHL